VEQGEGSAGWHDSAEGVRDAGETRRRGNDNDHRLGKGKKTGLAQQLRKVSWREKKPLQSLKLKVGSGLYITTGRLW